MNMLVTETGLSDRTLMRIRANNLAQQLMELSSEIHWVEIFGSLARGDGNLNSDFDTVLCVDDALAARWLILVNAEMNMADSYASTAAIRRKWALHILGLSDQMLRAHLGTPPHKQDFFLFPRSWRLPAMLELLQKRGHHTDPEFMQNIARDALKFVPGKGYPFPDKPEIPTDLKRAIVWHDSSVRSPSLAANYREIAIDPDNAVGIGTLFITDARSLIRPARPGQFAQYALHDTGRAYRIMEMGNDMGMYHTHILFDGTITEAHKMLDNLFSLYVNMACMDLWCDAVVNYQLPDGASYYKEYGFDDGRYTMSITVYCEVPQPQTEQFLTDLIGLELCDSYVVVRPEPSSTDYTAQHFINQSESRDNQ